MTDDDQKCLNLHIYEHYELGKFLHNFDSILRQQILSQEKLIKSIT